MLQVRVRSFVRTHSEQKKLSSENPPCPPLGKGGSSISLHLAVLRWISGNVGAPNCTRQHKKCLSFSSKIRLGNCQSHKVKFSYVHPGFRMVTVYVRGRQPVLHGCPAPASGKDDFSNKNADPSGELELRNITIIKWDHFLRGRSTFPRADRILFSIRD